MASDKISEVKLQFLYSAITIRPFLEQDVDLLLRFNNSLNNLQIDQSKNVSNVAQRIDDELRRNKSNSASSVNLARQFNDEEEKMKLLFE